MDDTTTKDDGQVTEEQMLAALAEIELAIRRLEEAYTTRYAGEELTLDITAPVGPARK